MITKHEAERISAAINQLRPEWPGPSLMTLIGNKLQHRPYRDLVVALAWIAADPDSKTPGRITEQGPWWQATATNGTLTYQGTPRNHETCPVDGHSGWKQNCPQCKADRLAADPDEPRPEPDADLDAIDRQVTYRRGIQAVRDALTQEQP